VCSCATRSNPLCFRLVRHVRVVQPTFNVARPAQQPTLRVARSLWSEWPVDAPKNRNAANSRESAANLFGGRPPNRATHAVIGTLRPTERRRAAINFQLRTFNGAEGDRTPDLCSAIAALSQLSYSPAKYATDCPRTSRADPSHRIKKQKPRGTTRGRSSMNLADPRLKSRPKFSSQTCNSLPSLMITPDIPPSDAPARRR
jgi:hypothetical protein